MCTCLRYVLTRTVGKEATTSLDSIVSMRATVFLCAMDKSSAFGEREHR